MFLQALDAGWIDVGRHVDVSVSGAYDSFQHAPHTVLQR
jgi:hypothetical protein